MAGGLVEFLAVVVVVIAGEDDFWTIDRLEELEPALEEAAVVTLRGGAGSVSDPSSLVSVDRLRFAEGLVDLPTMDAGRSPSPSFLSSGTLSRLVMKSIMSFITRELARISFSEARTSLRIFSIADDS